MQPELKPWRSLVIFLALAIPFVILHTPREGEGSLTTLWLVCLFVLFFHRGAIQIFWKNHFRQTVDRWLLGEVPSEPSRYHWLGLGATIVGIAIAFAMVEARQPIYFNQDDNFIQFLPVILAGCRRLFQHGELLVWSSLPAAGGTRRESRHLCANLSSHVPFLCAQHLRPRKRGMDTGCFRGTPPSGRRRFSLSPLPPSGLASSSRDRRDTFVSALRLFTDCGPFLVLHPAGESLAAGNCVRCPENERESVVGKDPLLALGRRRGISAGASFPRRKRAALGLHDGLYRSGDVFSCLVARREKAGLPHHGRVLAFLARADISSSDSAVDRDGKRTPLGVGKRDWNRVAESFCPDSLANAPQPNEWGSTQLEWMGEYYYAGTVFTLAALATLFLLTGIRWRKEILRRNLWLCLGGVAFLLALGDVGVLWTIQSTLPLFNKFTNPIKFCRSCISSSRSAAASCWNAGFAPPR